MAQSKNRYLSIFIIYLGRITIIVMGEGAVPPIKIFFSFFFYSREKAAAPQLRFLGYIYGGVLNLPTYIDISEAACFFFFFGSGKSQWPNLIIYSGRRPLPPKKVIIQL